MSGVSLGPWGASKNISQSARLGCGEVSDEVVNLGNCGVGWLPDASVLFWEMFVQHRGAGEDKVHPRREDLGEEFRCYGSGVPG